MTHGCHATATGVQVGPRARQGIHPTPWHWTLSHTCHTKRPEPIGHQKDASTSIGPLGNGHYPTPPGIYRTLGSARYPPPITHQRRRPRDTGGTPGRASDSLAKYNVPRLPRNRGGDARACIRPLAVHHIPSLARIKGGDQGTPERHQGVDPTPW